MNYLLFLKIHFYQINALCGFLSGLLHIVQHLLSITCLHWVMMLDPKKFIKDTLKYKIYYYKLPYQLNQIKTIKYILFQRCLWNLVSETPNLDVDSNTLFNSKSFFFSPSHKWLASFWSHSWLQKFNLE